MGRLLDSLTAPSAYRMKKDRAEWWGELVDRIAGAICPAHLDEIEAELDARPLDYPEGWRPDIDEMLEKRRDELKDEDINQILLDRFEF